MRREAEQRDKDQLQRAQVMTGLNKVAVHLAGVGSGSGSGSGSGAAPGSSGQDVALGVLGVMGQRERLRAGVFRPGHSLPTMTVEEFGEQEMRQMRERERAQQQAEAEARYGVEDKGGYDDGEYDEGAEVKARAWDDWKDDNPKGHGNSAIRPCGR